MSKSNHGWCVICGEDANDIREGRPVCDYHRSMCDGGYTIAEIDEEESGQDTPPAAETGARGEDENRDGHIFDMALKDGGTTRAVWLPETNANMIQLFIEQSYAAQLHMELATLQAKLAAAQLAHSDLLALIRKWTYTSMDGFTFVTDDHGEVAAAAQATGGSGEGVMDYQTKRERYHKKRSEYLQRRIDELKTALLWAQTGEERDRIIERINELQTQMDANDGK